MSHYEICNTVSQFFMKYIPVKLVKNVRCPKNVLKVRTIVKLQPLKLQYGSSACFEVR